MQAYFALYWWFSTWVVNSRQFTSNAFFFIIFFAQNAYLSILLGFWFFFFNVAHWFLYARVWNKMFWRDKKKFHNPVILFLRFVFLFWAVPFSFSGISAFFFLSNFFVGGGCFFWVVLVVVRGGRKMIFFIIHKQIFQDFSIFLYIFLILYRHFFLWNLYSKINQGKRSKIFVSTSFLQIMTWLISFFCF